MNGWGSHLGGGWDDEPAWLYEITWEWEPLPGQRYPGDPGRRRRAVHVPVSEVSGDPEVSGGHPRSESSMLPGPRPEPSWNRAVPLPERMPDEGWTAPGRRPYIGPAGSGPRAADGRPGAAAPSAPQRPAQQVWAAPDQRGPSYPARHPGPAPEPWEHGPADSHRPGSPASGHRVSGPPPADVRHPRPMSPPRPASPFEQTRPIPQEVRPQFRDAPPPVQHMPPPFYGTAQPTLRDARPRSTGTPRRDVPPGDAVRQPAFPPGDGIHQSAAPPGDAVRQPASPPGDGSRQPAAYRVEPPTDDGEPHYPGPSEVLASHARGPSGRPAPQPPGPRRAPEEPPAPRHPGERSHAIEPTEIYRPRPAGPGYRPAQPTPYHPGPADRTGYPTAELPGRTAHPISGGRAAYPVSGDRPAYPASGGPVPPYGPGSSEHLTPYRSGPGNQPPAHRDGYQDDRAASPAEMPPPGYPSVRPVSAAAGHPIAPGTPPGPLPPRWDTPEVYRQMRRPIPGDPQTAATRNLYGPAQRHVHAEPHDTASLPAPASGAVDAETTWAGTPTSAPSVFGTAAPDQTDPRIERPQHRPASPWEAPGADPATTLAGPMAAAQLPTPPSPVAPPLPAEAPVTAPPAHDYAPVEPVTGPPASSAPARPAAPAADTTREPVAAAEPIAATPTDTPSPTDTATPTDTPGPTDTAIPPDTAADQPNASHQPSATEGPIAVDVRWAETVTRPVTGEGLPDSRISSSESDDRQASAEDDLHGLGWRLKMFGLGAVTTKPDEDSGPAAIGDPPEVGTPEPEAAPKENWFAPATDTGSATAEPAAAGTEPAPDDGATSQPAPDDAATSQPGPDDAPTSPPGQPGTATSQPTHPDTATSQPTQPDTATSRPADQPAQADPRDQLRNRLADPEQVLSAYAWRFSPDTLREVVDEPDRLIAVRDRLTDKLEYAERDAVRARLLSLRAVVSRVLGDLDFALADAREAVQHAEATGELRRTAIAQARLANVLRWRGDYAEADRLFAEANSVELPSRLRAEIAELAGRSAYDQGRYLEAMNRFEEALDLRKGGDDEMVARIGTALDAVTARAAERGWGPYPRDPAEIRRRQEPETLPAGERWAEVQPFQERVAWVRRPESPAWELVDAHGHPVIDDRAGYLQGRPFADGLAWVSREPAGGFFAIDHENRVIVPGGFDDVLPFRHGVAPVRRGAGWGAIDRYGRVVIPPKYRRFVTALAGGRRVDGFTAEGLAVIDAGDRYGVIDHGGQLRVAPVHAAVVIHPLAFLIRDRSGRWGALDRDGDPLVDVTHRDEADVVQAIDELMADTRPVL